MEIADRRFSARRHLAPPVREASTGVAVSQTVPRCTITVDATEPQRRPRTASNVKTTIQDRRLSRWRCQWGWRPRRRLARHCWGHRVTASDGTWGRTHPDLVRGAAAVVNAVHRTGSGRTEVRRARPPIMITGRVTGARTRTARHASERVPREGCEVIQALMCRISQARLVPRDTVLRHRSLSADFGVLQVGYPTHTDHLWAIQR